MTNLKKSLTLFIFYSTLLSLSACSKLQTPESLIGQARQYQAKGDYKTAIIELKNALQKAPGNAEARFLLGTIYSKTDDAVSAEKELRKALELGMDPVKVLPALGQVILAQGKYQQALDEIKPVTGIKESPAISCIQGNSYLSLGKNQQAKASFEQALKSVPGYADALIGLSKLAMTENNSEEANRYAALAISSNPNNVSVWIYQGGLLRFQNKTDLALAAYDQALKIQPDNNVAHLDKAMLLINNKKYDVAKLEIDAAHKSNPNNLLYLYMQGLLDFRREKYTKSLESLQKMLHLAPDYMPGILLEGAVQYSLGSMQLAAQDFKKYLMKFPDNLTARKLLASTMLKTGQPKAALDILSPMLDDKTSDVQLLSLAGEAYMQIGEYPQALSYFTKASSLDPKLAALHTSLGMTKLAMGEADSATSEMETAVKLDVKSPDANILLCITELRLKHYDKALLAANAFEKLQPNNELVYNLKGGAYLGLNDITNARASFEKALEIKPDDLPAAKNLAQLDIQDNKAELAKKRYENMLARNKKSIPVMTALANLATARGNLQESTNWLEKASAENPDALEPSLNLIAHYLRTGKKEQALALAKKIQGSNTSDPRFLEILAQAQFANNDKRVALDTYYQLATLKPESAPVQLRIAVLQMAMKNPAEAEKALKKALNLKPDYLDAMLVLVNVEVELGNQDQALLLAQQIQKQSPAAGYELIGNLMLLQKKPDLAVKAFTQAFNIAPSSKLVVRLHLALTQSGQAKLANERLNGWLKDHPNDMEINMYQAGLLLVDKQYQAAIDKYQLILKQSPNFVPALNNLAWLYQQVKDSRALQYAEKANKLYPDNASTMDTLGWILLDQGNTTRALPLLEKAVSLAPGDNDVRYHFALCLIKSGDNVRARKELNNILINDHNYSKTNEVRTLLNQLPK
jgi:putative PEP-CTERM system TPR-repeat lipoprotein